MTEPTAPDPPAPDPAPPDGRLRRGLGGLVSLAAFVAVAVLAVPVWGALERRPRTSDGYLDADVVHMAPDVTGRIVSLPVANNQAVRRGDLLFVVDPEPYLHRRDAAAAKLRGLQAELATDTNTVASQGSKADAAQTSVRAAQAQLSLAAATQRRLEPLGAQGFVTREDVDKARTAAQTAAVDLESARQSARSARQGVSSTRPLEEQIASAEADLAEAERDLRLTRVLSPCDGQVTALDVAEGEYATAGRAVFTLIDTERWWAVANFRETDLDGLRPGQGATVYLVGFGNRAVRGVVQSLGGGVAPEQGSDAGGLPHVPRSLNWVQIAQRFPVRVRIDHPPPGLMRIGATATVAVDR